MRFEELPETIKQMRKLYLAEEMERLKKLKDEGKTREQIWEARHSSMIFEEDIDNLFADDEFKNDKFELLKVNDLIDYENQPFDVDNDQENEILINSIKLNGIIQPLIVRPYKNKYQILSGHRRKLCGIKAGLEEFPCIIREKNDEEAALYLVDANLGTRSELKPTERAKAYLMRKKAIRDGNLATKLEKYEAEIVEDNRSSLNIRDVLRKEVNVSMGNLQRYLRINYLNKSLQKAVDDKKINLKVAENLSFLNEDEQNIISYFIENKKIRISEKQAILLKEKSRDENMTQEMVENILLRKDESQVITIVFSRSELEPFFNNLDDKKEIKRILLKGLKYLNDITGCSRNSN